MRTAGKTKEAKAAPPAAAAEPDLPWMAPGSMSSRERAQAAQAASNGALRTLTEALQAGFQWSASPSGEWTQQRVLDTLRPGLAGVKVLRELYASTKPEQRLAVERGAFNLAFKCVALDMVSSETTNLGGYRIVVADG